MVQKAFPILGTQKDPGWGPSDDSDSKEPQRLSVHSLWLRAAEVELQLNCFLNGRYHEDRHRSRHPGQPAASVDRWKRLSEEKLEA